MPTEGVHDREEEEAARRTAIAATLALDGTAATEGLPAQVVRESPVEVGGPRCARRDDRRGGDCRGATAACAAAVNSCV